MYPSVQGNSKMLKGFLQNSREFCGMLKIQEDCTELKQRTVQSESIRTR